MALFGEDGLDEFVVEAQGVRVLAGNIGASWGVVPLAPHDGDRVVGYENAEEAAAGAVCVLRDLIRQERG